MSSTSRESKPLLPILFVDDDPMAHAIIDEYLEGREVRHAYSAEDALTTMEQESLAIVMSDIYMEEMDGIEFTRKIKKIRSTVQVIIMTGDGEVVNLINSLEAGANDFLVKPLKKERLIEVIEAAEAKIRRWQDALKDLFEKRGEA